MVVLTNLEFYRRQFTYLTMVQFADTLASIMKMNKPFSIPQDSIFKYESFTVDDKLFKTISRKSPKRVYRKYFHFKEGYPKVKYSDEDMKAVVAFMIQSGVFVHEDSYYRYNIFKLPDW